MTMIGMGRGLAALGAACSEPTAGALSEPEKEPTMAKNAAGEGKELRHLPFAQDQSFATREAYLPLLRDYAGPVGKRRCREVRYGAYQLFTTQVPPGPPQTFTREQLLGPFGFAN